MLRALALLLAGCGTVPPPVEAPSPAPAALPAPPRHVPDAVPKVERIVQGAPNAPYRMRGRTYEPETADVPMREVGIASWYGEPFHGRRAANGERYDMHAMVAAHRTMPLPSYARVRNTTNGREVIVRVIDRGPFRPGRIIDLSRAAARRLGLLANGLALVEVERLTHDDIRSGAWRDRSVRTSAAARAKPTQRTAEADGEARLR